MNKKDLEELRNWVGIWVKIPPHCKACALPKNSDMAVYTFLNNFEAKRFPVVCRCKPHKQGWKICRHGRMLFINH